MHMRCWLITNGERPKRGGCRPRLGDQSCHSATQHIGFSDDCVEWCRSDALNSTIKVLFTVLQLTLSVNGEKIMAHQILSEIAASISELKRNPMGTVAAGDGFPVAILNRNEPAFYCVPAEVFESMMDRLEDLELNALADARANQKRVKIKLDEL